MDNKDTSALTEVQPQAVEIIQPAKPLSPLADILIESLTKKEENHNDERKISVNPIVTKFASWYEKLRNAMEFREDEVILRATIERILKRRLLLGGNGKSTAEPLVKELLWARYLPDNEIAESKVHQVEESIDLHLTLRLSVLAEHRMPDSLINEWIYDLMSSDIQYILNSKRDKEIIANFMFQVLKDDVSITDDSEETKDAQVFIAVRKAFARDDIAFLRFHLFTQYFGKLTEKSLDSTVRKFAEGFEEIIKQLNYPGKERIYSYVKRRTAAFFIFEDVIIANKINLTELIEKPEELEKIVIEACETRYKGISKRVRTAIIRSVIFILLTKLAFAFVVEGTYERVFLGGIKWRSIIINTTVPPLLMVIVGLLIRTPGVDNSKLIYKYINQLLHQDNPQLGDRLTMAIEQEKNSLSHVIFNILWLISFVLSFGGMIFVLSKLNFNIISQFIFVFFLTIVSFLAYRISLLANVYRVGERQGLTTFVVDFFFMPVIRVGRKLTQSISQVNIFLYFFDFFIEAPFKLLFAFFDQWFYFLHRKTEEME
ncbi:MAG TPA: hypothetical protein VLG67_00255 [Candidatus Saccharimonadales bacterium]|nr:hypothetical protein [Candidatus Saccharimonadales bacterium]